MTKNLIKWKKNFIWLYFRSMNWGTYTCGIFLSLIRPKIICFLLWKDTTNMYIQYSSSLFKCQIFDLQIFLSQARNCSYVMIIMINKITKIWSQNQQEIYLFLFSSILLWNLDLRKINFIYSKLKYFTHVWLALSIIII